MYALSVLLSITFALMPVVLHQLYGMKFDRGPFVRWACLAAPVLLACQWFALATAQFGLSTSIAIGVAANVALAFKTLRHLHTFRRLDRWAVSLGAPGGEGAVADAVEAQLTKWWAPNQKRPDVAISWTLRFAERAILGGVPERALRWLDLVPANVLKPPMYAAAAQYRVSACIRLNDLVGARHVLATTPRPLPLREFEMAMQSMDGLLAVLEGGENTGESGAVEARAKQALDDVATPAAARLTWQLVQIHALAARHADDEARVLMRKVRAEQGEEPILRLIRHRGPGSQLAERLSDEEQPYR
jgi:hypothetical protein